jgi:hypothetical protein
MESSERVPGSFFDAELCARVAQLLVRLKPLATDFFLTHLDAPGWVVVNLGEESVASKARKPEPLLVHATMYKDEELGIHGTATQNGIQWEWSPVPRATVYGRLGSEGDWQAFRAVVHEIAPRVRAVLTYPASTR